MKRLIIFCAIFMHFWDWLLGGTISPSTTQQITHTVCNKKEFANYTFGFILDNNLPLGGFVEVTFPSQYPVNLGIDAQFPLKCSVNCVQADRQIRFYYDKELMKGASYDLTIERVLNPNYEGGTGNFWIKTVKGGQIIDQNLIFGVLGIASDIGQILTASVGLDSEGVQYAGELSRYVFTLRTSRFIPDNNFVRLYLPANEFEVVQFPTCSSYPVAGKIVNGRLVCESFQNRYIDVRGFVDQFTKDTNIGIVVTLRNARYAHITIEFGIAIMRDFTQIMYDRKLDIPGVTIQPGRINGITINKLDRDIAITRNKLMRFQLKFKLSNILHEGSIIKFIFPASFKLYDFQLLGTPVSYWVDFGMEDKTEHDPLKMQLDAVNDILIIQNYKAKEQPDDIILKFWATTPDNFGESSPIEIRSLTDVIGSYIIDEDVQFAKINVEDIPSPLDHTVTLSEDYAGLGRTVDITFLMKPGISIPANGFIKVIFDSRLIINEVDPSRCKIHKTSSPGPPVVFSMVNSQTCFKRNREIAIQLNAEQFTSKNTYSFQFAQVVESPTFGGKYFADVTTYQTDGVTKIESYTQIMSIRAAKLVFPLISLYPKEKFQKSILDLEFTVPFYVPHSRPQNISTETVSFINVGIEPSGPTSLQSDLGYGKYGDGNIPCYAVRGLIPVIGSQVDCKIFTGALPSVRISNYAALDPGTRVRLLIGDFSNPDGNFVAKVMIMKKFNRVLTEIASTQETLQITDGSGLPPMNDFRAINREDFYTASSREVNTEFEIFFNMKSQSIINGLEKMLIEFPHYDSGFIFLDIQPKCFVNDLPFTCYGIPYSDWILVEMESFQSIAVSSDVILKFTGLKWPRIEKPNPGNVKMRVVNITKDAKEVYMYPELIKAKPAAFNKISLVQDKKRRGDIDCRYTFEFATKTGIPNGGSLTMHFPSEYSLIVSNPVVRVSYPDFTNKSPTEKLSHFYTANKVKISNIGEIPVGGSFRIIFNGLRSPDYGGVMNSWFIDTQYNEFSLSRQEDFISISLDKAGDPGEIELISLIAFPTNADAKADYTFIVQPKIKLSIGSEIHVTFPSQFKVLPNPVYCDIDGGIKTFESCLQSFNSIVIRLDLDYEVEQGPITIKILDVINPDSGLTEPFEIFSKYDGAILELTSVALKDTRRIDVTPKASTIRIIETDINPQNEAELSTYTITFLPTNDIGFYQEMVFIFPATFDEKLGHKIKCKAISGIASNISCNRLVDRKLFIDGIDSYQVSPSRPIVMEISGIINPNRRTSNNEHGISLAILKRNSKVFIDYVQGEIKISPLKAPGWAYFFSITEQNLNCRYTTDYTVNFTATSSIPKLTSKGAVILDLPKQFDIDEKIIKAVSYSSEFGTSLNAEVLRNRIWISGNTNDFSGNVKLKVRTIDNPLDEVTTDNIIIRTYDGINKKIIERSFENLDPHYKTYVYPGPLIIINENKPINVAVGTQSNDIPILISGIAALNLTLVPTIPGFEILPFNVDIQIGQLYAYFRISVASDFTVGQYQVKWIIEGELIPRIYTPIKPTYVNIIKVSSIPIKIGSISEIPFGGISLPVFFNVDSSPDIGFTILLNMKKNYPGITLSKKVLNFTAGVKEQFFKIYYNDTKLASESPITEGYIDMQIFGVNQALYDMPYNTLKFKIITQDVIAPEVVTLKLDSVGKIGANITFTTSEESYAYYMWSLAGTKEPTKQEMLNQGPAPFASTRSKYGVTHVYSKFIGAVNLTKLEPQLDYVLYIMLQDKGARISKTFGKLVFSTKNRDNAADVSIKLKQSYISPYDKRIALDMIALVLSLPRDKVIEAKYTFSESTTNLNDNNRRTLQIPAGTGLEKFTEKTVIGKTKLNQVNTLLNFNIISVTTSEIYPTPKELGNRLNEKKIQIAARIPNFDEIYIIPSTEFLVYLPNFVTPPAIKTITYANITFSTRLNNFGWVYAVCVERDNAERSPDKPTPLQIHFGLDSQAIEVPHGVIEIEEKYKFYDVTVPDLKPSTQYTLFVIGANAHPGYPDLMESKFIANIDFTSADAPPIEMLDLSSGIPLSRTSFFKGCVAFVVFLVAYVTGCIG